MLYAKFGWNWLSSSEEDFQISTMYFAISLSSPLGNGCDSSFEKFEFPSPNNALYYFWLKLAKCVWGAGKKIFKFHKCIFTISLLSPLGKDCGPSFQQIGSPLPKHALLQVWLKLTQRLEKKRKIWKVYDDYDDDRQQTITNFHRRKTKEKVINRKFDAFAVEYGITSMTRETGLFTFSLVKKKFIINVKPLNIIYLHQIIDASRDFSKCSLNRWPLNFYQ